MPNPLLEIRGSDPAKSLKIWQPSHPPKPAADLWLCVPGLLRPPNYPADQPHVAAEVCLFQNLYALKDHYNFKDNIRASFVKPKGRNVHATFYKTRGYKKATLREYFPTWVIRHKARRIKFAQSDLRSVSSRAHLTKNPDPVTITRRSDKKDFKNEFQYD